MRKCIYGSPFVEIDNFREYGTCASLLSEKTRVWRTKDVPQNPAGSRPTAEQYYMHYGLRHKAPALIAPHAVAAKLDFVLYCVKVYPNAPNT